MRPGSTPEMHLDVAQLCHEYLASTDEAIRSGSYGSEKGIASGAGQERVRALHRHHLLTWARRTIAVVDTRGPTTRANVR